MPCLISLLALMTPRLVIVLLWFLSDWFTGIFDTIMWPLLGFFFLPTSLLWYTAVQHWWGGEWSVIPIVGMVIALSIDTSTAGGASRSRSRRDRDD